MNTIVIVKVCLSSPLPCPRLDVKRLIHNRRERSGEMDSCSIKTYDIQLVIDSVDIGGNTGKVLDLLYFLT